jgi:hypothetical protein
MARLLCIVNLEEAAISIYFKHHLLSLAHKTCAFARKNYRGEAKVLKLLEWGQAFEQELEYELAMSYYRDAYECAPSSELELAKKAIQCKLRCNERRKKP